MGLDGTVYVVQGSACIVEGGCVIVVPDSRDAAPTHIALLRMFRQRFSPHRRPKG
ncbi:MAG TPA: hypothetical protein VJ397_06925 [Thermoplasmata archaeon]|nr:hypothetical protein [Thermoplasmata archaeon]